MNEVMDHNEEIDVLQTYTANDFCRLCANIDDNLVSIFADEGVDHMLEDKIRTHLPFLNISENDVLPKRICYQCASAVLVWSELYVCSADADQKLRSMFEVASFEQNDCKTGSYNDIDIDVPVKNFIGDSIEYDDMNNVNMFHKPEKSDKTLNELDKIPSTSKNDNMLNHQLKSSVNSGDETLNSGMKRYIELRGTDPTLKSVTTKETSLSNNYSCSFCPEKFLKIRDKVKHDLYVHGFHSNILPIKFVNFDMNMDNHVEKNVDNNISTIVDLSDAKTKNCNFICIECNLSFNTSLEKSEHDQELHNNTHIPIRRSKRAVESINYGEIFDEDSDLDLGIKYTPSKSIPLSSNNLIKSKTIDQKIDSDLDSEKIIQEVRDDLIDSDTKSKTFKCYYCNKKFTSKFMTLKHVRTHMLENKKPILKNDIYDKYKVMIDDKLYYKCDQCNYAVEGRRYKFVYHMRVHTGEKPYTCEICSKQFRTAAFLRRHIICFHEKIRGYQCDICGRSFSEKRNVDDHRRTHTGERPFVCETCGKSFAQRSSMKIHWKQMHESIKSHKCQYCDKSFIRKCHLVAHLTHHTGVRNYVCAVCGKAFLRSGTLKGHTAVHSSERPFRCTICGDSFKLKKHLKQHGRVHGTQQTYTNVSQLDYSSPGIDHRGSQ